jgi:hypothetical protein
LKHTDSVSGNDSHLSHTIHAFPRQSQTWTNHDLRLATEKKPKTPFPKNKKAKLFLSRRSGSESTLPKLKMHPPKAL